MKLLIINGSPHGEKGNTGIFITQFVNGMKEIPMVSCIKKEKPEAIAEKIKNFDTILIVMPLYVHAMPGPVMKLFENLQVQNTGNKSLGCIVQMGFPGSAHADYARRCMKQQAKRLHMKYLGTAARCGAAGTSMVPNFMNRKLFKDLEKLGSYFQETGTFHRETVQKLAKPYKLTKSQCRFNQFLCKTGVDHIMWNKMLRENNAFENRFDRPFV